jgi:hypothetical protein
MQYVYHKNAEFDADFESVEKSAKYFTLKVINEKFIYSFFLFILLYHRERILKTSTLSCNEEEEEITKPPTR